MTIPSPRERPGAARRGQLRPLLCSGRTWCVPALVMVALMLAPLASGDEGPRPDTPQSMILGLFVDNREVSAAEVYFDGKEFLLPLDDFLAVCSCELKDDNGQITIETHLGNVLLAPGDITMREGLAHLREQVMIDRLAMRVSYSPGRLALLLDIPWVGREAAAAGPAATLTPEVRAPRLALSTAQIRARRSQRRDLGASSADTVLSGRAVGGQWRVRYDESFAARRRLSEFAWMRRFDDKLLMAGYQRVNLHPLLSGLEMTGLQGAWTNQPFELFSLNASGTELLPRQMRSTATISGAGVPAGTAVLRVNDRNVAVQTMGLDGLYDFQDVRLSTSRANRIEVLVYDRGSPTVPIDIHDHSRSASQQMLPAGAVMTQGGLGRPGNALHPTTQFGGTSGFLQSRYGVSSRLTLETAMQQNGGRREFVVGGVSQLATGVVASLAGASSDGRFGYLGDIEAYAGQWRFLASSQARQAGFQLGSDRFVDHFVDFSRRSNSGKWEVGVVGRYRRAQTGDQTFLLPAFSLRPWRGMSMRARPDYDGEYRFDMSWALASRLRLGATRSGHSSTAELTWQPGARLRAGLLAQMVPGAGHSQALRMSWAGGGRWQPAVIAGPMLTNGTLGLALGVQAAVMPGLLMAASFQSSSLLAEQGRESGPTVALALVGDLAFAGSRVVPGRSLGDYGTTGGAAGRIRVADGYKVDPDELAGLAVLVNGRPHARTTRGGKYLLTGLDEGVYRIEYDPERLPIELSPRERKRVVEVAAGAITRADFTLDVEFGIAGRVLVGGRKLGGLLVELVDASNDIVATGVTDRFGLFRIDGVRVGRYTLRLSADNAPGADVEWPSRPVSVIDDFIFDQDLVLEIGDGVDSVIAIYEAPVTETNPQAVAAAAPSAAPSSAARRLFAALRQPPPTNPPPTNPLPANPPPSVTRSEPLTTAPDVAAVADAASPPLQPLAPPSADTVLVPETLLTAEAVPAPRDDEAVRPEAGPDSRRSARSRVPADSLPAATADAASSREDRAVTTVSATTSDAENRGVVMGKRVGPVRPRLYEYVTVVEWVAVPAPRVRDHTTVVAALPPAPEWADLMVTAAPVEPVRPRLYEYVTVVAAAPVDDNDARTADALGLDNDAPGGDDAGASAGAGFRPGRRPPAVSPRGAAARQRSGPLSAMRSAIVADDMGMGRRR